MPTFQAGGGALIHYDDVGSGPLLVLVHGGTGTGAHDWEYVRGPLSDRHRLLVMDLRGHGRSSDPEFMLDLATIGDDILRLVEVVGARPAAIVGFSIGATAALLLLSREPGLAETLVCAGASVRGVPDRVDEFDNASWPADLIALRHEHGEGPDHWRRLRRRLAETWARDLHLGENDLRRLELPTLVVAGDRDRIEPVETAIEIARSLPRGELLVLPRAGHFVTRDRPAEFCAGVIGFLDRHVGRG